MLKVAIRAIALLSLSTAAIAQDKQFAVGAGISTLGLQLQGIYQATDALQLRGFLAGGISGSGQENVDGLNYDFSGSLISLGLVGDYFPTNSGLHFSGGIIGSNSGLNARVRADGANAITIGSTTYGSTGDGADMRIGFENSIAPLLSVGYRGQPSESWAIGAELGAIFIGGFDVQGTAVGNVSQSDLDAEVRNFDDDFNDADIYPFVSFNANYRF